LIAPRHLPEGLPLVVDVVVSGEMWPRFQHYGLYSPLAQLRRQGPSAGPGPDHHHHIVVVVVETRHSATSCGGFSSIGIPSMRGSRSQSRSLNPRLISPPLSNDGPS